MELMPSIGETIISPISVVDQVKALRMSKLQMVAVSSFLDKAINITCGVISSSPLSSDESEPALLLVQGCGFNLDNNYLQYEKNYNYYAGLLQSVSNLTVTFINSTTVLISWSPPFTLEGVPILGYDVTLDVSGESKTMLVEGQTTNLYHTINRSEIDSIQLIVTVIPINAAGAGKPTFIFFSHLLSEYQFHSFLGHLSNITIM